MIIKLKRIKQTDGNYIYDHMEHKQNNEKSRLLEHCGVINGYFSNHKFIEIMSNIFLHGVEEIVFYHNSKVVTYDAINKNSFFNLKCHTAQCEIDNKINCDLLEEKYKYCEHVLDNQR